MFEQLNVSFKNASLFEVFSRCKMACITVIKQFMTLTKIHFSFTYLTKHVTTTRARMRAHLCMFVDLNKTTTLTSDIFTYFNGMRFW